MKNFLFILLIFCLFSCCVAQLDASKSKGLFSGDILSIQIEAYVSNTSDSPGFVAEKEEAVRINPQDTQSWIEIGKTQLKMENWQNAGETFLKAIEQDPKNTEGWNGYLLALSRQENYIELLDQSKKSIEINPEWAKGYYFNGNALYMLKMTVSPEGSCEEAVKAYEKAIDLNPDDYDSWVGKGNALSMMGSRDEALEAFDKAIQMEPDNVYAWSWKGSTLNDMHKYTDALDAYNKAIQLNPELGYLWSEKAKSLMGLQKYEDAKVAYDKALELNPEDGYVWSDRGQLLLYQLDKPGEAVESYEKALQYWNKDYMTYFPWMRLGEALKDVGDYEKALNIYDKAIEFNPDDAYLLDSKAWALYHLGRYDEALEMSEKSISVKPDDPANYNYYKTKSTILSAMGRSSEAEIAQENALKFG